MGQQAIVRPKNTLYSDFFENIHPCDQLCNSTLSVAEFGVGSSNFIKMKNPLSIVLIVVGLILGIYGITQLGDSGKSVEVAGIELGVKDKGAQTQAYMFIGLGVLSLIGGLAMSRRK